MKKTSAKTAVSVFNADLQKVNSFLTSAKTTLTAEYINWAHEYAIIRLYRAFEQLILGCLVAAINNNTNHLSEKTQTTFPKHLTDAVCRYIIVGTGHFNFKAREGLINELKNYLPNKHYIVKAVKDEKYKDALNKLVALRNYAAHNSEPAKKRALAVIGGRKLSSAGAWLKSQGRFDKIATALGKLADEIHSAAPY